jgi:hypothetical protein
MAGTDGLTIASAPIIARAAPDWHIKAAADMNGDGAADLILQNDVSNAVSIWFMNAGGQSFYAAPLIHVAAAGWKLAAAGDINSDGVPDLLFQQQDTRQVSVWFMNPGALSFGSAPVVASPAQGSTLTGVSDLDGSGTLDYIFQNRATGEVSEWLVSGRQGDRFSSTTTVATAASGWQVVAAR